MKLQWSTLFLAVLLSAAVSFGISYSVFKSALTAQAELIQSESYAHQVSFSNIGVSASFPEDFSQTAERTRPAVVSVSNYGRGGYKTGDGSGVIISEDGYIATNYHVVEDGRAFSITLADNRDFSAQLIGMDPTTDLALLKVEERGLPFLEFGDSDRAEVGNWVLAIGNPFELTSTVTAGIVSARGRSLGINRSSGNYGVESFIQTDAVVNPGNSGGALVNTRGELVGINTAIYSKGGSFEGYSFAVPSNLVQKVMRDLREYGKVRRALLGINIVDVDSRDASRLSLPSVSGIRITKMTQDGTAERAGFAINDVIVQINETPVNTTPELQEAVATLRPGEYIDVMYYRQGKLYRKRNVRLMELADNQP